MLPLKPLQLLPAASFVFRRIVRSYSKLLVNRATRVFEFADKYRGSYSDGLNSVVCPFYCSYSGYQVDYILGSNPVSMSYMVGNGPKYPGKIHHRGSSLPSISAHPDKIQCSSEFSFMNSQSPNPNVLVGAIVWWS
ncbi:hypothetical protein Droror1_Dr00009542 [Drosera rotundifolia]